MMLQRFDFAHTPFIEQPLCFVHSESAMFGEDAHKSEVELDKQSRLYWHGFVSHLHMVLLVHSSASKKLMHEMLVALHVPAVGSMVEGTNVHPGTDSHPFLVL